MIAEKSDRRAMFSSTQLEQACSDCGSTLKVVEQVNESGTSFIWYKCTRTACSGQWLERRIPAIRDY